MYFFAMKNMFQKIPVELTKPPIPKKTIIITCYWRWLVYEKLSKNITPLKKIKLIKKVQENEDEIRINLHKANQYWYYWEFQIHWNKLEWVNPRSCNELKNPVLCLQKQFV